MTQFVTYTQRLNAFRKPTTWTVDARGLRWQETGEGAQSGFIAIEDITSVRLRFEPSRAERRRTALHVYNPIDHPITNINFRGILDFEHQKTEFFEFADAFHAAFPNDTKTVFHKGSTRGACIGNILLTLGILALLLLIAPIVSVTGAPSATSIFRLVIILIFFPVLIKVIYRNKPGTYRPNAWPKEMLE